MTNKNEEAEPTLGFPPNEEASGFPELKIGGVTSLEMTTKSRGENPVFPSVVPLDERPVAHFGGISIREYFSALAMQGLISNPKCLWTRGEKIQAAVAYADALITELDKGAK